MKSGIPPSIERLALCAAVVALVIIGTGCNQAGTQLPEKAAEPRRAGTDLLPMVLVRQVGETATDKEIRQRQEEIRAGRQPEVALERLGWLFVAKARETFDSGYYKLAEVCADCLNTRVPGSLDALLLRGHALQSLHHFKDAELAARELVEKRGRPFDFGLLGDALMEQGKLAEAIPAYQQMLDLRPDLQSYSRAAHLRWLKGDLEGARPVMRLAAGAGSPADPETFAWAWVRLATYEWQAGDPATASAALDTALQRQPGYATALLLRGRMLMGEGNFSGAIEPLQSAVKANPLPEGQWALADTLRATGREAEAQEVEAEIRRRGAAADPRSYALFLATRRIDTAEAVRLARLELADRADIFTHDALAWAAHTDGRSADALTHLAAALAEGTQDARLFLHAGVIAADRDPVAARAWLAKAAALRRMLLPSEQQWLDRAMAPVASADTAFLHQTKQTQLKQKP